MSILSNTSRYLSRKNVIPFIKLDIKDQVKSIKVFLKAKTLKTKVLVTVYIDQDKKCQNSIEYSNFDNGYIIIDGSKLKGKVTLYFDVLEGDVLFLTDNREICYELEYNNDSDILISIVTPTYNSNVSHFKETYNSVISQSYKNWEWCIVDDGSTDENIKKFLKNIKDSRISVKFLRKNKGISYATTEAIKISKGPFIGFLDHDDLLTPDCLQEVVKVIKQNNDVKLIYSDEDKVIWNGNYIDPFYKPDFNYMLLLNSMYIGHFLVIKKDLIEQINYLRTGYEGSQDYDLVLRTVEKIESKNIKHIPKVLYHWRVTENSTSYSILNKPYARINGLRALEDHLNKQNISVKVYGGNFPCHYNVKFLFQLGKIPSISIIIPFKDKVTLLKNLLNTLEITNYNSGYKIILVDNNSEKEETKKFLKLIDKNKYNLVKYEKEFNFSKIINSVVFNYVNSDLVLLLNNDIEIIHPEWLYNMAQYFVWEDVSVVGPKLLYIDHRIQHAGVFVGVDGEIARHIAKGIYDWDLSYFCRPHLTQEVSAVTGACMLIRVSDFKKVNGFDENLPTAFNDVDFCLKIKNQLNKKIIYTPTAKLYHLESATRGYDNIKDKKFLKYIEYMKKKWNLDSFIDPFYNKNLKGIL